MQLNLFNNLSHLFGASIRANYSFLEIHSRVANQLIENNAKLMQSSLTASTRILTENTTRSDQYAIAGMLVNECLRSALEAGKTATNILQSSRGDFEKWAISSAGEFGANASSLVPIRKA